MEIKDKKSTIEGIFKNCFLDYASYVVLDRAIPAIEDGLKPVQRRILFSMYLNDDGRFNKVANIIGNTMQLHPHGDASIGDALVGLGQKNILIETQGNWGDPRTGDPAAASRYIEARLTTLAKQTCFNLDITETKPSYDGRKQEPVRLPIKFPLLLIQGVEGIAVGLSTKILPHNFNEVIQAAIHYLEEKPFALFPDFYTGAQADYSAYSDGEKGSRVKVRAKIEIRDATTLEITQIPFGITTSTLIQSIIKANETGKIKIKKITDNTAKNIQVSLEISPNQNIETVKEALFAFTDCQFTLYPNACVIINQRPTFLSVREILKISAENTMDLLKQELLIVEKNLKEKIFFLSLEQIFIEKKIYHSIEDCSSWNSVLNTIEKGMKPYISSLYRPIEKEDIIKLTEIKIKKISKYDATLSNKNKQELEKELEKTGEKLKFIRAHTIGYLKELLKKYGKDYPRKTEICSFDTISLRQVVAKNTKLYVDKKEGFMGYSLKNEEYVCDCADIDEVIVFCDNGTFLVSKIEKKKFIQKNIIYISVFGHQNKVYQMIYLDKKENIYRVKRFEIQGITRDKLYDLTPNYNEAKVIYFSLHDRDAVDGGEEVEILLHPRCRAKNKKLYFCFSSLAVKGRQARGNILTTYPIKKVKKHLK